ncbi:MAG TPA: hypothetical protein VN661_12485 [Candidatus Acidoferrales bacterium]|nr:hypothetical protein [Candidatus Acidoferrales bacterium]
MARSAHIPPLIRELRAAGATRRECAAAQLFQAGRDLAIAASVRWFADRALAACFALAKDSGLPEITVGIAVEPRSFDEIRAASGSPPLADVPPDQDAKEFTLDFPGGVRVDILTTRAQGGSGAVERFLARFGEGIQQVEFAVSNLDRATEILRERFAAEPVYPAARPGADGARVNFFLVPTAGEAKVLIELVESHS